MNYMTDIKKAKELARMKNEADIIAFEKIIERLLENKNSNVLDSLFQLFDDQCTYPEVMYGLVHAVESFPQDLYIKHFVNNFHRMINNNPIWTDTLTNRILNDQSYTQEFAKHAAKLDKSDFISLMKVMEKESPHHQQLLENIFKSTFLNN